MNFFQKIGRNFRNLKLNRKFSLVFIVLVIGIGLIGFVFQTALNIGDHAVNETLGLGKFSAKIEQININVLNARRYEKEFQTTNQLKFLEQFETSMVQAHDQIGQLKPLLKSELNQKDLDKLADTLKSYQSAFYQSVEVQVEMGLDQNSGLRGELQGAALELQDQLSALAVLQLDNFLLEMRALEKSFLATGSDEVVQKMAAVHNKFSRTVKSTSLEQSAKVEMGILLTAYSDIFKETIAVNKRYSQSFREMQTAASQIAPAVTTLTQIKDQYQTDNNNEYKDLRTTITYNFLVAVVLIPVIMILILIFVARSILRPISHFQDTVAKISAGDYEARTGIASEDEIGELAQGFDALLDERVTTLAQSGKEGDMLNTSIVELLQAVSQLSEKDLTVHVPVAENITGTLADAMNLLTVEISKVLKGVTSISDQVNNSAVMVKDQSNTVMSLSETESEEVEQMLKELNIATRSVIKITELAQTSNKASGEAMEATDAALVSVNQTVQGINQSRDMIRETEKRIKRLGERSQEISGIVSIINEIAERTNVLALNASMQAASAGEAGKGFMVVANEVQRLAENSREAAGQITGLVKNIQVDTSDTANTMNSLITEVVEGTRLAEEAGSRMQKNRETTQALVQSVEEIFKSAQVQVKISNSLRQRAVKIQESTQETNAQLQEQAGHTDGLVKYSEELIAAVGVFKLPA